ncbi:MAG: FHA domain-containing protein [Anaerolineales bacterium]
MAEQGRRLMLLMEAGPDAGALLDLEAGTITLGRGVDNDVVLDHAEISRHHAEVGVSPLGTVVLKDLNSTNGTFIEGEPVSGTVRLYPDQSFSLADVARFRLIAPQTVSPSPQPPPASALPEVEEPLEEDTSTPVPQTKSPRWLYVLIIGMALLICLFLLLGVYLWFAPIAFWETLLDPLGIQLP